MSSPYKFINPEFSVPARKGYAKERAEGFPGRKENFSKRQKFRRRDVRNLLIFPLLLSVLLIPSLSPLEAQEKTYSDPGGGFSVTYPEDMVIRDTKSPNSLTLYSEEKKLGVGILYTDARGLPGSNIQQLCAQYPFIEQMLIAQVKNSGFQVTSKQEVTFKGIPALAYGMESNKENDIFSGD